MIRALLAAQLVAAQQHSAPAGAHAVLLAGVIVAALVFLGVGWWRRRRDASTVHELPSSGDLPDESTHPKEDE